MRKLHPKQQVLLNILSKNQDDPLTIRDLQSRIGASSTSVVMHHLKQLEEKGYLRRNPANPHDYQILAENPDAYVTYLNMYGMAQCGPDGSLLSGNPLERIAVPTKMLGFPSSEAFMVKARGNSMEPFIKEGDLVIARMANNADDGDIVVCVNESKVLIKKLKKDASRIILRSLNEQHEPFIASEDLRIEGIVKGVYSYIG